MTTLGKNDGSALAQANDKVRGELAISETPDPVGAK
jgi:hypothetical protein